VGISYRRYQGDKSGKERNNQNTQRGWNKNKEKKKIYPEKQTLFALGNRFLILDEILLEVSNFYCKTIQRERKPRYANKENREIGIRIKNFLALERLVSFS